MAQIAGRAGRHMNDGSFGITDGCRALEPEMIDAIEQHRFAPLRAFTGAIVILDLRQLIVC